MVIITLTDVPQTLRGDLTKWLFEINVGVYVGQISARVRDELWNRIVDHAKVGRVTMVYQTNNEQHFAYRVHNSAWKPIDFDGLTLMMRPNTEAVQTNRLRPGFSNAAHRRIARRIQKAESAKTKRDTDSVIIDTGCNAEHSDMFVKTDVRNENAVSDITSLDSSSAPNDCSGTAEYHGNYSENITDYLPPKSSISEIDLGYMIDRLGIRGVKQDDNTPKRVIVRSSTDIEYQNNKNYKKQSQKPKPVDDCILSVQKSHDNITSFSSSYVVIDLETTGLDENENEIIEIGALRIVNGKIHEQFQKLVLIQNDIPPFITKLTGITDDMIDEGGEELSYVLDAFIAFIGQDLLVAHNITFDLKFLNMALTQLGRPRISNPQKCTYELSKRLFPSMKSRKLSALCKEFGIMVSKMHRSLSDCECVFHVYEYMLHLLHQ